MSVNEYDSNDTPLIQGTCAHRSFRCTWARVYVQVWVPELQPMPRLESTQARELDACTVPLDAVLLNTIMATCLYCWFGYPNASLTLL